MSAGPISSGLLTAAHLDDLTRLVRLCGAKDIPARWLIEAIARRKTRKQGE